MFSAAAVAKLAEARNQIPAETRPAFLEQLVPVEIRLGEPALARQYCRELAELQPANLQVMMVEFDLALQATDDQDAQVLVNKIRTVEGNEGTTWRFGQAALLLDRARRGKTKDLSAARVLAAEIAERRPSWWGSPVLNAEIAEIDGQPDGAIMNYRRAI